MPYATLIEEEIYQDTAPQSVIRRRPESFDSAEEFSLERLGHAIKLVEAEYQDLDGCVFDDSCLRVA